MTGADISRHRTYPARRSCGVLRAVCSGQAMEQEQSNNDVPEGALPLDKAIREFVPAQLWAKFHEAEENCRGLSRRTMWLSPWLHGERAHSVNRRSRYVKQMFAQRDAAERRIVDAFRTMLRVDSLIAYGRETIRGELSPIPAHMWRYLRLGVRSGTARGDDTKLYDVRIARKDLPFSSRKDAVDGPSQDHNARGSQEHQRIAAEDEASECQRARLPRSESLQITVIEAAKKIVILDIWELVGANYKLVLTLSRIAREDLSHERAPENHRYMTSIALADNLGVEEPTARKRVSACRAKFSEMYLEKCGRKPPRDMLIETRHGLGCRLNPWVRFVAPTEVR